MTTTCTDHDDRVDRRVDRRSTATGHPIVGPTERCPLVTVAETGP